MGSAVLWWAMLEGLGVLVLPLLFPLFGATAARGYPFAKIAAPLLLTFVAAWLALLVPLPTAVAVALTALVIASAVAAWRQRSALAAWLRGGGIADVARHAALFAVGYGLFVWVRGTGPDIFGAEKFMDFAFFNVLARSDAPLPPEDPWMAGHSITYYYFGYLIFATLARLAPVAESVAYNLCVATIGGLAFSMTAAVAYQLTRRWFWAILSGAMSPLLGNLDGFLQFMEDGTLRGMNLWRSSRVVGADGATINEFPFFSTIHGDLHPHFMVLPVGILLLGLLLDERRFPDRAADQPTGMDAWLSWGLLTFVFGAMVTISTWELPTALVVTTLLSGRWQPLRPFFSRERLRLAGQLVGMVVIGVLAFAPFRAHLPFNGVGVQFADTNLGEFLTVFGLLLYGPALLVASRLVVGAPLTNEWRHLLIALGAFGIVAALFAGNAVFPVLAVLLGGALFAAYRGAEERRAGYLLIAAAATALLACEVVFIRDTYGERLYRMNTVFKLYFQAWTILAVASPWAVQQLLAARWRHRAVPVAVQVGLAALVAAAACGPVGAMLDRAQVGFWTIDGNAHLVRHHPGDWAAIEWLREHAAQDAVVLEATGNPYSYFARISSNTGMPTVLGWANHEGLWRGHGWNDNEVGRRRRDVERLYRARDLATVEPLLERYDVRYIVVGESERESYPGPGLEKFAALDAVLRHRGTTVYRR